MTTPEMTTETKPARTLEEIHTQECGDNHDPERCAEMAVYREIYALGAASRASPDEGRAREALELVRDEFATGARWTAQRTARVVEVVRSALRSPPPEPRPDSLRALAVEFRNDPDAHQAPTTAHVLANAVDAAPPPEDSGARMPIAAKWRPVPGGTYVVAANRRTNRAVCWASAVNSSNLRAIFWEVETLGLARPITIYGHTCAVSETKSFRFCQVAGSVVGFGAPASSKEGGAMSVGTLDWPLKVETVYDAPNTAGAKLVCATCGADACVHARASCERQEAEIAALRAEIEQLTREKGEACDAVLAEISAKTRARAERDEARASLVSAEDSLRGVTLELGDTLASLARVTKALDEARRTARHYSADAAALSVECARLRASPAPGPAPEVRCATFDATSIPPEARATMDADRKAAEDAAPRCVHGTTPPITCEHCARGTGRASHEGAKP